MSEKISFNIEAAVKGLKDITSTTTATERLTEAVEAQREAMKQSKRQLNELESYDKAKARIKKLGGELDNARSKYQRLGDELKQQNKTNAATRAEYKRTQKTLAGLQAEMKNTSGDGLKPLQREAQNAERKMQQLDDELRRGQQASEELRVDYRKSKSAVSQLTGKKIKQIQKTRNLRSELRKAGVNTRDFANEQKRLEAASEKASAQLHKQSKRLREMQTIQSRIDNRDSKMSEIGGKATTLAMQSLPIVAAIRSSVKDEQDFSGFKKTSKLSPEETAAMREFARNSGTTLDSKEIYDILEAGSQTGISTKKELLDFTMDTAKISTAFDMDTMKTSSAVSGIKSSMGLSQREVYAFAGLQNLLSNETNAKAPDLLNVMSREGSTAKSAGFTKEEGSALAASLLSTGMGEERSATALKNISIALSAGESATGPMKEAYTKLGLTAQGVATSMQQDAQGTLLEVLNAIKDAPIEEQAALTSQLFGREIVGGVNALLSNTGKLEEAFVHASRSEKDFIQSIEDEYAIKNNTTGAKIKKFWLQIKRVNKLFGDSLKPVLDTVLPPLTNMMKGLGDFMKANQGITATVGMLATGFIGLNAILLGAKAASLFFGNTMDKTRLYRKGLNRETREGGRVAQFAARQWQNLNRTVRNSNPRSGQYNSDYGNGYEPRKREGPSERVKRKARRPRAKFRRKGRGVTGLIRAGINWMMQPSVTQSVKNTALRGGNMAMDTARAMNPIHNKKAVALSLGGGAIAAMPATAMAADAIGITGDIAESAGKLGLARILKPLSFAVNSVEAYRGIRDGNGEQTGAALGDLGGSLGGAAAGAALGSIVPGIGTAIGGLIGGIAGGLGGQEIGAWFGRKLDPPEVMAEKINEVQRKEAEARQQPPVNFAPTINVNPSQGHDEKKVAQEAVRQLDERYAYIMGGNDISTQLGYSGIDQD